MPAPIARGPAARPSGCRGCPIRRRRCPTSAHRCTVEDGKPRNSAASQIGRKLEMAASVGQMHVYSRTLEGGLMSKRGVVMLMGVLALSGCAEMRKDKACKWGLPAWGAAMGGVGAGLGVSQGDGDASDGEIAGAAAGGTIVGGLAGWLLGHYICEEEALPPPAPPPPPPPPARHKIETLVGPNFDF